MISRRFHAVFSLVWLAAFAISSIVLPWAVVRCEEPGGRVAIELAGEHGLCPTRFAPLHDHEPAGALTTCTACSSCPCVDTPVGIALASPRQRTVRLARCNGYGLGTLPPPCDAMPGPDRTRLPAAPGSPAHRADRVTRRCLGSIVLLV